VSASTDREDVARLISKYDLLAVPVVDDAGRVLGIVTVDDVIDAIVQESTEDVQKLGGMEPLDRPYMRIGLGIMIKKRAGWPSALFLSEMLTASAMQSFQSELEKALMLTLFIPLIMSSGGNSGSQATSLIVRALALREVALGDWWRIAMRELPAGAILGAILGIIGVARIALWQLLGFYDYGPHWSLIAATVASALIGVVTFGSLSGSSCHRSTDVAPTAPSAAIWVLPYASLRDGSRFVRRPYTGFVPLSSTAGSSFLGRRPGNPGGIFGLIVFAP
jgi:magnesium transporter